LIPKGLSVGVGGLPAAGAAGNKGVGALPPVRLNAGTPNGGFGDLERGGPPNIPVGAAGAVDARGSSGFGPKRLGVVVAKRLLVEAAAVAGCFPNPKVTGAGAVGAASLVAGMLKRGVGVEADAGPLRVDNNGGVLGLLLTGCPSPSSAAPSSLSGTTLGVSLGDSGVGKGGVGLVSSSSSGGRTVFANGELRVGRVLGRPSPRLKGCTGEGEGANIGLDPGKGLTSFMGVPGGVVLGSLACGDGDACFSSASASGDGDT